MATPSTSRPDGAAVCCACTILATAAFVLATAITFLVLGILGATGKLHMAPIGAEIMIGLGMAIIVGMIGGVVKACCK